MNSLTHSPSGERSETRGSIPDPGDMRRPCRSGTAAAWPKGRDGRVALRLPAHDEGVLAAVLPIHPSSPSGERRPIAFVTLGRAQRDPGVHSWPCGTCAGPCQSALPEVQPMLPSRCFARPAVQEVSIPDLSLPLPLIS